MVKLTLLCGAVLGPIAAQADGPVLIVADEMPAMELLATQLRADGHDPVQLVTQTNLPARLADFAAVVVYLHFDLHAPAESALIDYTERGGKLVALHHSISSGKRKNARWFPFLGVALAEKTVDEGGYKWIEDVTLEVVSLAPTHFITSNRVEYPTSIAYVSSAAGGPSQPRPGFTLTASEVYLNHTFTAPRTGLLGFKYTDAATGRVYQQDRAGWVKPAGRGWVVYLMPGHSVKDFANPAYARIVANAVAWQP